VSSTLGFGAGDIVRDSIVLVVGWALGILSSPITDMIRRRSAKVRMTRVIVTELRSLQDTLALVVLQVSKRRGALTRPLLEALLTTLKSSGHGHAEGRTMRTIEGLLELAEDASSTTQVGDTANIPRTLSLKVHGLPFVESHLHRLDLYSHETQRMLVEIRTGLQAFNQYAEEATHYHFMMFGSGIGQDSRDLLKSNIETCYERAAEKASDLIARIAVLLQNAEMRLT
jgi:hypothetical protein